MTRIRTTRTSKYLTISNLTAQDHTLTFQALGLLTYCLSMPSEWDFHPQVIWKLRDCGRDACYGMFNELIASFHCIRIRKPNPKAKNLPGEIEYEIFDEVEDCKKRISELQKTENFLEHGANIKKSLRQTAFQYPEPWDPEARDPEKPYLLKETSKTKENLEINQTTTTKETYEASPPAAAVFLDQKEKKTATAKIEQTPVANGIYPSLLNIDMPEHDKIEISQRYNQAIVENAVKWAIEPSNPPSKCIAASIKYACKNGLSVQDLSIPKNNTPEVINPPSYYASFNRFYWREIDKFLRRMSFISGIRELGEYLDFGHQKLYYKDKAFLEQLSSYLRKKNADPEVHRLIAEYKEHFSKQ